MHSCLEIKFTNVFIDIKKLQEFLSSLKNLFWPKIGIFFADHFCRRESLPFHFMHSFITHKDGENGDQPSFFGPCPYYSAFVLFNFDFDILSQKRFYKNQEKYRITLICFSL